MRRLRSREVLRWFLLPVLHARAPCAGAFDCNLLSQRERDVEGTFAERLDLGIAARLLVAEVIGRHADDYEAFFSVTLVQGR